MIKLFLIFALFITLSLLQEKCNSYCGSDFDCDPKGGECTMCDMFQHECKSSASCNIDCTSDSECGKKNIWDLCENCIRGKCKLGASCGQPCETSDHCTRGCFWCNTKTKLCDNIKCGDTCEVGKEIYCDPNCSRCVDSKCGIGRPCNATCSRNGDCSLDCSVCVNGSCKGCRGDCRKGTCESWCRCAMNKFCVPPFD